ncbi:MAG: DUF86 domain-containing protein [Myxococcales bacterium]|nr:DUF86 domain-containing protein [Myxococcales bacterium]
MPGEFAARFRAIAGFRNILVHGYLAVDFALLHGVLNHRLDDFVESARHVEACASRCRGHERTQGRRPAGQHAHAPGAESDRPARPRYDAAGRRRAAPSSSRCAGSTLGAPRGRSPCCASSRGRCCLVS